MTGLGAEKSAIGVSSENLHTQVNRTFVSLDPSNICCYIRMSTPPQRPPTFLDRSQGTDRDAPGEGRLASSGPSGLTRGGNTRTKFVPKVVARRTAAGYWTPEARLRG